MTMSGTIFKSLLLVVAIVFGATIENCALD